MSRSSRALGVPEGIFETCPQSRHVMEAKLKSCPYCLDEQQGQAARGGSNRNPVNALDQLRRDALNVGEENGGADGDAAPQPLMRTQVRHQVDSFRNPPAPAVPPPAPPLSQAEPPGDIANIGPGNAPAKPSASPSPFGGPPGFSGGDAGGGLNKTQPLAAVVSGEVKTHVMVSVVTQTPVLGWIRGLNGPIKGRSFNICHGRNILGSAESCSVVIPSADVRPRHVSIMASDQGVVATLTDTESTLKVNGVQTETQTLVDGDLLEFGPAAFRFRCLSKRDLTSAPREGYSP